MGDPVTSTYSLFASKTLSFRWSKGISFRVCLSLFFWHLNCKETFTILIPNNLSVVVTWFEWCHLICYDVIWCSTEEEIDHLKLMNWGLFDKPEKLKMRKNLSMLQKWKSNNGTVCFVFWLANKCCTPVWKSFSWVFKEDLIYLFQNKFFV